MYLFVGAHPDDIEIGSGGFLIKSLEEKKECFVIVFSDCEEQKGNKGISKEFKKAMETLGVKYKLYHLKNTKLPKNSEKIRKILEKIKKEKKPELIITHSLSSIHQDHKTVAEECRRVFRFESLISYEDPKSTRKFNPSLYVPLSEKMLNKKIEILNIYQTQKRRSYFGPEIFKTIARKRGIECGIIYAEAYEIVRLIKK